jgi:thioredoxin-like negative regulator of GroEL
MKLHSIIVIIVAFALSAFLYFQPKSVVKNELKANRDKQKSEKKKETDNHSESLTNEQIKKVNELKIKLQKEPQNSTIINKEIAEVFLAANRIDSAAFYVEKIATISPTNENWQRAGDAYFQAFNLAIRQENISSLADKTRFCYNKVLENNPHNLQAKTNLAMTYVGSDTPMQAIMTLREVIDENPNYIPALMNLGVLSMQSNQYDKAYERFRAVLQIDPKNVNAQFGIGYSLIELKKTKEAKEVFLALKNSVKEPSLLEEVNKTLESLK